MELLALNHLIWVLPLLLIALAVAYWAFVQRRRAIAQLTQGAQHCQLRSNAGPIRRRVLAAVLLASLLLALLAVLRPIGGTEISEHRRPAKNLVVLLDISKSMTAVDAEGISRIEAAKLLLREFINKRPTDRIGLVSFAGATFTESPVTLDRSILLSKVNQIVPGDIPVGGTDIDSALREAQHLLTEEPPPGSAIIVLSDGDNVTGQEPKEVLALLKKANVPVLAIALGLDGIDTTVPFNDLSTKADHATLRNLSDSTNGLLVVASPREVDAQVADLSQRVDAIELNGENIAAEVFERPLDLYAWPLSIALLCLMIHFLLPLRTKVWRPLSAVLLFCLFLPQTSTAQLRIQPTRDPDVSELFEGLTKALEPRFLTIFTGSDWSETSITFEREILSHQVFKNWAEETVELRIIDLPRVGLNDQERNKRRARAKELEVESYPMAVFHDAEDNIIGTLTHDPDGPASWIKRADAILSGDEGKSDSAASVEFLPEEIRKSLEDADLTPAQRSVAFYNKALELEKAQPELTFSSKDRFKLLIDLYSRAASAAPVDRADLSAAARLKIALLHHRKGQALIPKSTEELTFMAMAQESTPLDILKAAKRALDNALATYKLAVPLKPNDEELSANLALAYKHHNRVQDYIKFIKSYNEAVIKTDTALTQEARFADSLDREVTTRLEVNTKAIDRSGLAIFFLIANAKAIETPPTILPPDGLNDYVLAIKDIIFAPQPHRERDLRAAQQHIQNALDHLIDPQQQQAQQSQGEGEEEGEDEGPGQPGDGSPGGKGEGEEEGEGGRQKDQEGQGKGEDGDNPQGDKPGGNAPGKGDEPLEENGGAGKNEDENDTEGDLRRAEKESGDLRGRLMERMRKDQFQRGQRVPRNKDH